MTSLERWLLFKALLTVAAVRIALWIIPFRVLRKITARHPKDASLESVPPKRLAWAVQAAARRIPGASCLTQALAFQYLLTRSGETSQVHVGVVKGDTGQLKSHAWVEYQGEIMIGDNGELETYSPITALGVRGT